MQRCCAHSVRYSAYDGNNSTVMRALCCLPARTGTGCGLRASPKMTSETSWLWQVGACPDEIGLLSGRRSRTTEDRGVSRLTCSHRIDAAQRSAGIQLPESGEGIPT